jgi:hypothetical protein
MNMKRIAIIIAAVISAQTVTAQLKSTPICPVFKIDVLEGVINERLDCNSTAGEVKKLFPCFTHEKEETGGATCGGVFYKDKDISFFTERDYIEIGEKFKGQLTPALMGVSRGSLFTVLGNPQIKDATWDAFKTKFGILVIYYNQAGKINKVQISTKSAESIKLCE